MTSNLKTALIVFIEKDCPINAEYIAEITNVFYQNGFNLFGVEMLSLSDDLGFKHSIEKFKDTVDNLVVVNNKKTSFNIKEVICSVMDKPLVVNQNAKNFFDAVVTATEKSADMLDYFLPVESTLIPNVVGSVQGFMLDEKEFTLTFLPEEANQFMLMASKYLFPYLEQKHLVNVKRVTLKYFGDEKLLISALEKAKEIYQINFRYSLAVSYGDVKLDLQFNKNDEKLASDVVRFLVSSFIDEFYAEYDVSLSERLFDALKLKKLKLSTAESFTAGRVVGSIINYSGASDVVDEGIVCYSNDSKEYRLGVKKESLIKNGAVSSVVAYEMALGLLKRGKCNIAIATTGIAGPKSDNTDKPVGLCYIAVGMHDGIHTYKYNFNGNREEITNLAKNTATYLAIKKIKKL